MLAKVTRLLARFSAMCGVVIGATEAEFRERVERTMGVFGLPIDQAGGWIERRRGANYLLGTPDRILSRIAEYQAAGLERMMLQVWLPTDLEMVTLLAREVLPHA